MWDLLAQSNAGDISTWVSGGFATIAAGLIVWMTQELSKKMDLLISETKELREMVGKLTKSNLFLILELRGDRISPAEKREVEDQIREVDDHK